MRRALRLVLLLGVALAAGYFLVQGLGRLVQQPPEPVAARLAPGAPMRGIRLFFGAADRVGLKAEDRVIPDPGGDEALGEAVAREVLRGPASGTSGLWPQGQVRAFYLGADGVGYLDLTSDVLARWPKGDGLEWVSVGALVRSITENVPAVRAVQLLFDGRMASRAPGAIPLDLPLEPDGFLDADGEADARPTEPRAARRDGAARTSEEVTG